MAKRRTKRTVKKPSGDHTSNTSNCTNVQEATMKPYGSSHVKIFGQVDVNLENTVHLLQTNGVKVTVRDEEPVRRTIPISLGRGKENDPNKAIYIDKGKRERFRGLISQKELCALTPPIEGVVRDVPKGSQISSKRSKITSKHGSLSINPLTPAPLDVLHANVTSAASTATPDRFGISKRLNIHSLVIPRNLGIELLPLQLNKHAIKTNLPWLEQRHLYPVSACSFPVSSTSTALNFASNLPSCSLSFSSVPQTSTSLSSECVEKSDISRRTLAQRARRERERSQGLIRAPRTFPGLTPTRRKILTMRRYEPQREATYNLALMSSTGNAVQPITNSMEDSYGELNNATSTFSMITFPSSAKRDLMDNPGVPKRRKVMCDVNLPLMPNTSIAPRNECDENQFQIEMSLAPSTFTQVDIHSIEGQDNDVDVTLNTNIVPGLPHLQPTSICQSLAASSSRGLHNEAVAIEADSSRGVIRARSTFPGVALTQTKIGGMNIYRAQGKVTGITSSGPHTESATELITSFREHTQEGSKATTSTSNMLSISTTSQVDRTLSADDNVPNKRKRMCGVESSSTPNIMQGLPHLHPISTCSFPIKSSSGGQRTQVAPPEAEPNNLPSSSMSFSFLPHI